MSPFIRYRENCLVLPFFQGSRLLKNDSEVLLTDSNLAKTDVTDSLTLNYRKIDGGCYLNSFWIIQILISYLPNSQVTNYMFFILFY